MLMDKLLLYILPVILILGCKKDNDNDELKAETYSNIAYGSHQQQKMDVYLPQGRNLTETKAIILIHGGGWNAGDKSDFAEYINVLKQRLPGYAIFNINYRLATGTNMFPAQEMDVKAAIDFIISKSSSYIFNSEKLVLLGASAGAHLALLQAYKYDQPKIKAVIDFFGPTDLIDMYNNPPNFLVPGLLQTVTGGSPNTHTSIYQQSSPLNFITSNDPPTLILHGGADNIVAVSQSQSLSNLLTATGAPNQLVIYANESHGWLGLNLDDSFNRIESWLATHVP